MKNNILKLYIYLAAPLLFSGVVRAGECIKTIDETGWSPLNERPLDRDVRFASRANRLSKLQKKFGTRPFRIFSDGQSRALWVYGAKKEVVTNDCGRVDVKYYLEGHFISVAIDGDKITSCEVLKRTIVSSSNKISPLQDRDVLPFSIEKNTCKEWLGFNESKKNNLPE